MYSRHRSYVAVSIILLILFASCRSFDKTLLTRTAYLAPGLTDIELQVNTESVKQCFPADHANVIRIIQQNLQITDTSSKAKGYMSVIVRKIHGHANGLWVAFCPVVSFFLGVPVASQTWSVEVEAAIFDCQGILIKKYNGYGESKNYGAMYWGYGGSGVARTDYDNSLRRTCYLESLIKAVADLKQKMDNDSTEINNKLRLG